MSRFTPDQIKQAKKDQYRYGYEGKFQVPPAVGLGATLRTCYISGQEDKAAGKEAVPHCGPEQVAGRTRRRRRVNKKKSRKAKKSRRN